MRTAANAPPRIKVGGRIWQSVIFYYNKNMLTIQSFHSGFLQKIIHLIAAGILNGHMLLRSQGTCEQ